MAKYKFKHDRMGFTAGRVIDGTDVTEGVLSTLIAFGAVELVQPKTKPKSKATSKSKNVNKLDSGTNNSAIGSSGESGGSESSPAAE